PDVVSYRFGSVAPGGFAGDAAFALEKALINLGGIEAPAGGQKGDLIGIGSEGLRCAERCAFSRLGVVSAFQAEFGFGWGPEALFPNGFSGPGISADDAPCFGFDPGMMVQNPAGAEELDVAEPAAELEHKTERCVHVVAWIRKSRANDEDPA